jgi:hypothetical protein
MAKCRFRRYIDLPNPKEKREGTPLWATLAKSVRLPQTPDHWQKCETPITRVTSAEAREKKKCTQENVYIPNHEQIQILTIGSIMKIRAEHLNNSQVVSQVVVKS